MLYVAADLWYSSDTLWSTTVWHYLEGRIYSEAVPSCGQSHCGFADALDVQICGAVVTLCGQSHYSTVLKPGGELICDTAVILCG